MTEPQEVLLTGQDGLAWPVKLYEEHRLKGYSEVTLLAHARNLQAALGEEPSFSQLDPPPGAGKEVLVKWIVGLQRKAIRSEDSKGTPQSTSSKPDPSVSMQSTSAGTTKSVMALFGRSSELPRVSGNCTEDALSSGGTSDVGRLLGSSLERVHPDVRALVSKVDALSLEVVELRSMHTSALSVLSNFTSEEKACLADIGTMGRRLHESESSLEASFASRLRECESSLEASDSRFEARIHRLEEAQRLSEVSMDKLRSQCQALFQEGRQQTRESFAAELNRIQDLSAQLEGLANGLIEEGNSRKADVEKIVTDIAEVQGALQAEVLDRWASEKETIERLQVVRAAIQQEASSRNEACKELRASALEEAKARDEGLCTEAKLREESEAQLDQHWRKMLQDQRKLREEAENDLATQHTALRRELEIERRRITEGIANLKESFNRFRGFRQEELVTLTQEVLNHKSAVDDVRDSLKQELLARVETEERLEREMRAVTAALESERDARYRADEHKNHDAQQKELDRLDAQKRRQHDHQQRQDEQQRQQQQDLARATTRVTAPRQEDASQEQLLRKQHQQLTKRRQEDSPPQQQQQQQLLRQQQLELARRRQEDASQQQQHQQQQKLEVRRVSPKHLRPADQSDTPLDQLHPRADALQQLRRAEQRDTATLQLRQAGAAEQPETAPRGDWPFAFARSRSDRTRSNSPQEGRVVVHRPHAWHEHLDRVGRSDPSDILDEERLLLHDQLQRDSGSGWSPIRDDELLATRTDERFR